jgi:hypothetical protein
MPHLSKIRRLAITIAALGALAAAPGAKAQGDAFGPLSTLLVDGATAPWSQRMTDDGYVLQNATADRAIRLFWSTPNAASFGARTVTAEVEIGLAQDSSRVGILYGYREDPTFYFMYVLQADGTVALYRRDETGINQVLSTGAAGVQDGVNQLSIEESGPNLRLFVNGTNTATINTGGTGAGALGVVAWGTGQFVIHSYSELVDASVLQTVPGESPPAGAESVLRLSPQIPAP